LPCPGWPDTRTVRQPDLLVRLAHIRSCADLQHHRQSDPSLLALRPARLLRVVTARQTVAIAISHPERAQDRFSNRRRSYEGARLRRAVWGAPSGPLRQTTSPHLSLAHSPP